MSEQLREALSAIVDGEASEFELRRVLDEMGKDESLVRAWQSYHLIRQSAQGENVQGVADMGDRIWAALDAEEFLEQDIVQEEPALAAVAVPSRKPWGMIGGALAAALALGVFMSSNLDSSNTSPAQVAQVVPTPEATPEVTLPPQTAFAVTLADPTTVGSAVQVGSAVPASREQFSADDFDYGPGFVPYSALSDADRARTEGYFLHHVQHQAVNNDNVLSFVKMISYPQ